MRQWADRNRYRRQYGGLFVSYEEILEAGNSISTMRIDQTNTGVATIEEKNDLGCFRDKSIVAERVVEVRTLDSFEFSDVAMIKIDVEGHEEAVVAGAEETIRRCRPSLLIESEER